MAGLALALLGMASTAEADDQTIVEPTERGGEGWALLMRQSPEFQASFYEDGWALLPRGAEDSSFDGFRALVHFQQPLERTLDLLRDAERQKEYREELRDVEHIGNGTGWHIDEHRLRIAFVRIAYRIRLRHDVESVRVHWELDPDFDNDLERVEGFWELYALDEKSTLGHFGTIVEVGAGLPGFLQDAVTARNLPTMLENVRRWVDSGGTYRP